MAEATETALACIREEVERAFSSAPGAVLEAALSRIAPADECARAAAYAAWDSIAHPLGGLGEIGKNMTVFETPSRVSPQLRGAPRWPSFPVRSRYSSPTTGSLPKACRKAGKT